jgi:hypothetical protein
MSAAQSSIPALMILGPGSYPAVRALGVASKFYFIGPRLGKAMTDPELVNQMIILAKSNANSPAHKSRFSKFTKMLWDKGIPLTTRTGVDIMVNPKNGEEIPVGTAY